VGGKVCNETTRSRGEKFLIYLFPDCTRTYEQIEGAKKLGPSKQGGMEAGNESQISQQNIGKMGNKFHHPLLPRGQTDSTYMTRWECPEEERLRWG
jgi:hypothetical protein